MNGGLVRGLMTMAIGVLLIVMGDGAMELLVRLVGVAFFLPALVSFVSVYSRRKEAGKFTSMAIAVIDIGCMAFGLWLLVNPFSFQSVFVKLLAVILLVIALFQVYEVLSTSLRRSGGWKMLVAPLLIAQKLDEPLRGKVIATLEAISTALATKPGCHSLKAKLNLNSAIPN